MRLDSKRVQPPETHRLLFENPWADDKRSHPEECCISTPLLSNGHVSLVVLTLFTSWPDTYRDYCTHGRHKEMVLSRYAGSPTHITLLSKAILRRRGPQEELGTALFMHSVQSVPDMDITSIIVSNNRRFLLSATDGWRIKFRMPTPTCNPRTKLSTMKMSLSSLSSEAGA